MPVVTFAREYRHRIDDLRTAIYPPGRIEVSSDIAAAAHAAGALKKEARPRGKRSSA